MNFTLTEMIQRIHHRIELPAATNNTVGSILHFEFGDPGPVLEDLEGFIAGGGAAYLITTARRV